MLEIPTKLAEAVADSRRARIWDSVPTEPTAEMVAAPVHIVVVTWKAPPVNAGDGDRVCWAIAGHHLVTGHFMQTGELAEERPMNAIVGNVLAVLEEQGQTAWVVVSKSGLCSPPPCKPLG